MDNNIKNAKELELLKNEKIETLVVLGQILHKDCRSGKISDAVTMQLSEKIMNLDIKFYAESGKRIPKKEEGICPGCGEKLPSGIATFCADCGLNVEEFYSANMVPCKKCGQLISKSASYCSICGTFCND